jgi:hypothetical protein
MPTRKLGKLVLRSPAAKVSEILDVPTTAEPLTVSPDPISDLFTAPDIHKSSCAPLTKAWIKRGVRRSRVTASRSAARGCGRLTPHP